MPYLPPLNLIKMMFHEEVKVNVKDNQGHGPLTLLLKHSSFGSYGKEKIAMLMFAAGETVDEYKMWKVLHYLKPSGDMNLMNICRETIRKHLLQMSDVNLFVRVPRLPLPGLMTSYLLYDVTLDYDEDNKESESE